MFKKVKNFLMMGITVPEWVLMIMSFFFGYGIVSMTGDIVIISGNRRHH